MEQCTNCSTKFKPTDDWHQCPPCTNLCDIYSDVHKDKYGFRPRGIKVTQEDLDDLIGEEV